MKRPMTSAEIDESITLLCVLSADPDSPVETPVSGWSDEDLADIIGCSPSAIKRRTRRALLSMKKKLPAEFNPNNS